MRPLRNASDSGSSADLGSEQRGSQSVRPRTGGKRPCFRARAQATAWMAPEALFISPNTDLRTTVGGAVEAPQSAPDRHLRWHHERRCHLRFAKIQPRSSGCSPASSSAPRIAANSPDIWPRFGRFSLRPITSAIAHNLRQYRGVARPRMLQFLENQNGAALSKQGARPALAEGEAGIFPARFYVCCSLVGYVLLSRRCSTRHA